MYEVDNWSSKTQEITLFRAQIIKPINCINFNQLVETTAYTAFRHLWLDRIFLLILVRPVTLVYLGFLPHQFFAFDAVQQLVV